MPNKHSRLANLRLLIKREGAVSQLALRLQISPIYIYRVLDGKFNIGDSMARKIEDAYGFPAGWMDGNHDGAETAEMHIPTLETSQRVVPPLREATTPTAPAAAAVAAAPAVAETPARAPTAPVTPSIAPAIASAASPSAEVPAQGAPARRPGEEEVRQRVVSAIINTMDRLLVANNVEMSDLEKARLLMKAAEAVLDGSAATRPLGGPQKSFLKIS